MIESTVTDVSIIIVSYNACVSTCRCLASIYREVKSVRFGVILVDNASSDGTVEVVRQRFPDVRVICSGANLGYGRANNMGVQSARGEYLFLLNPDAVLLNDQFVYFIDYQKNKNGGGKGMILGGYLRDEDGMFSLSGGTFYSCRKFLVAALKRFVINPSTQKLIYRNEEAKVDYVIGADMFISRDDFMRVGGFDERIFMYYEDVELCKRLVSAGCQSYLILGPEIIHNSQSSHFARVQNVASLMYCIRKEKSAFCFLVFQSVLFLLRLPFLLKISKFKQNLEWLLAIFKYKNYLAK